MDDIRENPVNNCEQSSDEYTLDVHHGELHNGNQCSNNSLSLNINLPVLSSIMNKQDLDNKSHIDMYEESSIIHVPMLSNIIKQELSNSAVNDDINATDSDSNNVTFTYTGMSVYLPVHSIKII